MEKVKKEIYKNHKIVIYQDEYAESPDRWEDEGLFLVGYHRDFEVRRDDIITKEEAIEAFGKKSFEKYWIFGLEAYIHGSVTLAISYEGDFCDRRWDVSQLGLVLVAKNEARLRKKAKILAEGLIETWNRYLSGDVYGFKLFSLDENGKKDEEIDSVWGFYGEEGIEQIIADCKQTINYRIEKKTKEYELEANS